MDCKRERERAVREWDEIPDTYLVERERDWKAAWERERGKEKESNEWMG